MIYLADRLDQDTIRCKKPTMKQLTEDGWIDYLRTNGKVLECWNTDTKVWEHMDCEDVYA